MLNKYFEKIFIKLLSNSAFGQLKFTNPEGKEFVFGGKEDGPIASLKVTDADLYQRVILRGDIGLAEGFRDNLWSSDDLISLCEFGLCNQEAISGLVLGSPVSRFIKAVSYSLLRRNSIVGSKKNIHAHYDLGNDFYRLWLDPTMTYSSAMFQSPDDSLEQAQFNKYDRILSFLPESGRRVLEIGCGWGGFAERMLQDRDNSITCLTISDAQKQYATNRLKGFGGNAQVRLEDYRQVNCKYDSIVSIEMFEAVGEQYWPHYFRKIYENLTNKGLAIIQSITIKDDYFATYQKGGDAIREFIFPGGMLPSCSRFIQEAKKEGLCAEEPFFFGSSYARTLESWLRNFQAKEEQIRKLGFDSAFIRLWRFYLSACAAAFRSGRTNVMQIALIKP